MCGISFLWQATTSTEELGQRIKQMARAQEHRGPDACGSLVLGNAAIAHNRLRILDLDPRADQPFCSEEGDAVLSFNGEIYNHQELRAELESLGATFKTTSDTEALYHALRAWGTDAMPRLNGMFAFVWYDPAREQLLIARDRIGIKPLYLVHGSDHTLVSSEIKGLFASGLLAPRLSANALHQVMRFNHTLGTSTAFEGVLAIEPGSYTLIELASGHLTSNVYWRPRFRQDRSRSFTERVGDLNERFRNAVRLQSHADVGIASFMSGGLDSTGLAAEAREVLGEDHMTYSMVFPNVPYSEEATVDRVVESRGDRNTKVPITGVTLEQYVKYIQSAEMPQWWTTDLSLMLLAEGVHRRGHRVAISGEGPDEFLAGYEVYRFMKIRRLLQTIGIAGLLKNKAIQRLIVAAFKPWYKIDLSMIGYYLSRHENTREEELIARYGFHPENLAMWEILSPVLDQLLRPELRKEKQGYLTEEANFFDGSVKPFINGDTQLEANLYFEIRHRLPNWILHMSDRVSAANQIELRLPYLENEMVDGMLALHQSDRIRGLKEKYILKQVHKARVPRFIQKKKKQPLYTPAYEWVRGFSQEEYWSQYWSSGSFDEVGFFDFKRCEALRQELEANAQQTELERLAAEWSYCLILSVHVLHRAMQDQLHEVLQLTGESDRV